jgi:hypothetical protein
MDVAANEIYAVDRYSNSNKAYFTGHISKITKQLAIDIK